MSTVKLTIDGTPVECDAGLNVIQAAALAGKKVPHYCWHPDLPVSGNCRMCVVEIETPRGPKAEIACNLRVSDGLVVHLENERIEQMRKQVLEFLFLNHPLDCPICDKAGECLLQDYYQEHGRYESRLDEDVGKRSKGVKAQPLSDLIMFDNERCILCDRCVRFCREVEGKEELFIAGRGSPSRIITFENRPLTGEYQLCLTDICPVGALTSRDFRFHKRVWFLDRARTVCGLRDTGDNILVEYDGETIYRIMPRRHDGINGVWVKDVSRLAYKQWQADRQRMAAIDGSPATNADALSAVAADLCGAAEGKCLVLVDNRLTLEEAYALKKAVRAAVAHAPSRLAIERGPNGYGLDLLGIPALAPEQFDTADVILAVGDFEQELIDSLADRKGVLVATAHTWGVPRGARAVLPLNEHMERTGTFVNRQKRLQRAEKAFEATQPNVSGLEIAAAVADKLGVEFSWTGSKSAFSAFAGEYLDRPGMPWKELGRFGLLLDGQDPERPTAAISGHKQMTWSG